MSFQSFFVAYIYLIKGSAFNELCVKTLGIHVLSVYSATKNLHFFAISLIPRVVESQKVRANRVLESANGNGVISITHHRFSGCYGDGGEMRIELVAMEYVLCFILFHHCDLS